LIIVGEVGRLKMTAIHVQIPTTKRCAMGRFTLMCLVILLQFLTCLSALNTKLPS
jgi:hypothetical protein